MDNGADSYRRYIDGDDSGLVEIIRDYKDGLVLYLYRFTGSMSTAEDIMEDVFVKLATKKPAFSGKSAFKTWLYAIGRNMAADHMGRRRFSFVSMDECGELRDARDIEASYIKKEQSEALKKNLDKLKSEYRQVLYLIYFEGFTNAETAVIMHKNKRQIENLIYRAKKSLRTELEKEGFGYEEL